MGTPRNLTPIEKRLRAARLELATIKAKFDRLSDKGWSGFQRAGGTMSPYQATLSKSRSGGAFEKKQWLIRKQRELEDEISRLESDIEQGERQPPPSAAARPVEPGENAKKFGSQAEAIAWVKEKRLPLNPAERVVHLASPYDSLSWHGYNGPGWYVMMDMHRRGGPRDKQRLATDRPLMRGGQYVRENARQRARSWFLDRLLDTNKVGRRYDPAP